MSARIAPSLSACTTSRSATAGNSIGIYCREVPSSLIAPVTIATSPHFGSGLNPARCANPYESIRADRYQFFNCNCGRRAPNSRGSDRDFLPEQLAGVGHIFAVLRNEFWLIQICGDLFTIYPGSPGKRTYRPTSPLTK